MEPAGSLSEDVLDRLESGGIAAALFYSRRTAETFVALAGQRLTRAARVRLGMLCLSEAIAEPLIDNHFVRIGLAEAASEAAMMRLALSFAREQNPS
jgi:uroporphyrinogen-III synthase